MAENPENPESTEAPEPVKEWRFGDGGAIRSDGSGAWPNLRALTPDPTQVRRPWRATARTVFQALVALAVIFPILVSTAGLDPESLPWLAIPLAVAAAIARVMALPQVETFLRQFVPFLAAAPAATVPEETA